MILCQLSSYWHNAFKSNVGVTKGTGWYTGCPVKLFPLGYLLFCRLLLMQISKVGTFLKNSRNLLQDRHKNFEN